MSNNAVEDHLLAALKNPFSSRQLPFVMYRDRTGIEPSTIRIIKI